MILQLDGLTKSFGAFMSVKNFSCTISEGELLALIGPNGAGKSTVLNLITGFLKPDSWKITFKGEDITKFPPHRVSQRGIGLAFQVSSIFPKLTAYQNVQAPLFISRGKTTHLFSSASRMFQDEVTEILGKVGLLEKAYATADSLAQADRKRLELGMALATGADLLLLDEPTAGQSAKETPEVMELIRSINKDKGLTILFIEHKMDVVFGIAQRIIVMHHGRIIADGEPEAVRKNEEVQKAYLGEVE